MIKSNAMPSPSMLKKRAKSAAKSFSTAAGLQPFSHELRAERRQMVGFAKALQLKIVFDRAQLRDQTGNRHESLFLQRLAERKGELVGIESHLLHSIFGDDRVQFFEKFSLKAS